MRSIRWYLLTLLLAVNCVWANNYSISKEQFNKYPPQDFSRILLIINYNHPFYDSIPFLKELYSSAFPNIVFYGEKPHPDVNVIPHHYGWWAHRVIADAMERWPSFEGYLCIQDDCFINFWNFGRFDTNKIWFKNLDIISLQPHHDNWNYWNLPSGEAAILSVYNQIPEHYRSQMIYNIGEEIAPYSWSDFVYIPARLRESYLELCPLFLNPPVFIELAIPSILTCLDDKSNWEYASLLNSHTDPRHVGALMWYQTTYDWVHPFKFSIPEVRQFAKYVIDEWKAETRKAILKK